MWTSETRQRLSQIKAIYNRHYNYIRASYPELAWRLSELDSAVTAFEDEIETLLEQNKALSSQRRKPIPKAEEIIEQALEELDLKSYTDIKDL